MGMKHYGKREVKKLSLMQFNIIQIMGRKPQIIQLTNAGRDFHLKEKILCLWEMGNKSIIDAKVF